MEFISVIIHSLWCTVSDCWCFLKILLPYTATLRKGKTAYLYRLWVNAETIFDSIHFCGYSFPDCIAEGGSDFTSVIVLFAGYKNGKLKLIFLQLCKQQWLTVNTNCFWCHIQCHYFKVWESGNYFSSWYIAWFID